MHTRRVVTGHNEQGKAVFTINEVVEPIASAVAPGYEFRRIWGADTIPEFPDAGQPRPSHDYFPPTGGIRFATFTVPPTQVVDLDDIDFEEAAAEMEERLPGLAGHMEPDNPGMHTTASIDFDYVVSGRVVLELDDGSFLTESGAIMEYIEEIHPEPSMLGSSPLERARLRELHCIAEMGVLGAAAQLVHATNSPLGLPAIPDLAAQARVALAGPMKRLDDLLADGRPFVAGEQPTLADCTLQAAFQFARFREIEILEGCAHLARWDAAYRDREPARSVLAV